MLSLAMWPWGPLSRRMSGSVTGLTALVLLDRRLRGCSGRSGSICIIPEDGKIWQLLRVDNLPLYCLYCNQQARMSCQIVESSLTGIREIKN